MSDADFWQGATNDIPVVNADGNLFEETQLAAAGQTVFTLATFQYTPNTKSIIVFKNGNMLRRGVDYAETDSTHITLAAGAALNDKITFIAWAIQQIIPPIVYNGMPSGGIAGQVLTKTSGSDYEAAWEDAGTATTLLDSARQNIASASTINLSAIATQTRNILITGTVQIDGFQVANGEVWVVRFANALILKNNANIVTQAGQDIRVSPGDSCLVRATADNVVEIIAYSRAAASLQQNYNDFRLSLTTGVPVTTADVTAATNLYMVPYKGDKISLYNGTGWIVRETAQISLALAGLTVNRPYDVFCYDSGGVPTLEILAWTSNTVRATALATQDGIYVKAGDATRKYLGSFYALSATTTEDSARQRLVWNYYNRVKRACLRTDPAGTWVYSAGAYRQANANALNQINVMCGVVEDCVEFVLRGLASNTNAGVAHAVVIGLDTTGGPVANSITTQGIVPTANGYAISSATVEDYAQLGFHFYTWLEINSSGAGVLTWSGGTNSGINGSVMA